MAPEIRQNPNRFSFEPDSVFRELVLARDCGSDRLTNEFEPYSFFFESGKVNLRGVGRLNFLQHG